MTGAIPENDANQDDPDHPDLGPDLVRAHLEIMRENGDEIPASLLALELLINR